MRAALLAALAALAVLAALAPRAAAVEAVPLSAWERMAQVQLPPIEKLKPVGSVLDAVPPVPSFAAGEAVAAGPDVEELARLTGVEGTEGRALQPLALARAAALLSTRGAGAGAGAGAGDVFVEVESAAAPKDLSVDEDALPPFEQLPSASPLDGLDSKGLNPLKNPMPLPGANQNLKEHQDPLPASLPTVGQILGGSVPEGGKLTFTPGGELPPLVTRIPPFPTPPPPKRPLLVPEVQIKYGGFPVWTQQEAATPMPPTVASLGLGNAPPAMPKVDALSFPIMPSIPADTPIPGSPNALKELFAKLPRQPPSDSQQFAQLKKVYEAERAQYLALMDKRKSQIDFLKQYVDGGEAWVAKMQKQWDDWMQQERQQGSRTIEQEREKVNKLKAKLDALVAAQRQDAERVNSYNAALRKAAYELTLQQHKARLDAEVARQKALKAEIERSEAHRAEVEKKMAEVNTALQKAGAGPNLPPGEIVPSTSLATLTSDLAALADSENKLPPVGLVAKPPASPK
jgi:hypothetical protein